MKSLNPYSTGSNSNFIQDIYSVCWYDVLILILLEVTQITAQHRLLLSAVVLILILLEVTQMKYMMSASSCIIRNVLILILLEVTQIASELVDRPALAS